MKVSINYHQSQRGNENEEEVDQKDCMGLLALIFELYQAVCEKLKLEKFKEELILEATIHKSGGLPKAYCEFFRTRKSPCRSTISKMKGYEAIISAMATNIVITEKEGVSIKAGGGIKSILEYLEAV